MATCRAIITDALFEIGVLGEGEVPTAGQGMFGLLRLNHQIDAWAADRLTIFNTVRTTFTLTSGTSTLLIGPTGDVVTVGPRPDWLIGINYIVPGTSPAVETPMGQMDDDSYMNLSIKSLPSNLPTQFYYNETVPDGTLTFWPVVAQDVDLACYFPASMGVPTTLDSELTGPPGYEEAFMYQLAIRLCTPFGRQPPPLLPQMAADAYARIKRANTQPGLLGVDPALVGGGAGYNVYNDNFGGTKR